MRFKKMEKELFNQLMKEWEELKNVAKQIYSKPKESEKGNKPINVSTVADAYPPERILKTKIEKINNILETMRTEYK